MANSSQPALPFSILLQHWGASPWFTLCLSAHLAFFFFHWLSLQRTRLPDSHSLPLICFSVWQSKHCPSDTSVCLRLSFHLWRWEWNVIWQEVGFTVCYLTVKQSPLISALCLSIRADLFSSISDQRCWVKLWSEISWSTADHPQQQVVQSYSHHQSANKDPHK